MIFNSEEYKRGIVFWDIPDAILCVASAASPENRDEWFEALIISSGSPAPIPRRPYRRVHIVARQEIGELQPTYQIRWEFLHESEAHIATWIWNDVAAEATTLAFVPNYGIFHRLVIAVPLLAWPEDIVLRSGDIVVRLFNGPVIGEWVGDIGTVTVSQNRVTAETERLRTVGAEGRFAEIIAPGPSPEQAEIAAYSLLGYLGLCLGRHAVGQIAFSERYEAGPNRQTMAVDVPSVGQSPWPVDAAEFDALDKGFDAAAAALEMNGAVALGLRWYERGIRADAPLDKLLSFFVGVEAIVTEFGSRNAPLPIVQQRQQQHAQLLTDLEVQLAVEAFNSVKSRLIEPSLSDYFGFYAERHRLEEDSWRWFRAARKVRNDVFHGASVDVNAEIAANTRRLLGMLLRLELGLPSMLPWEQSATMLGIRMVYDLVPRKPM